MTTTIALSMPPSTNRLWTRINGRVFKTERYRTWLRAADNEFVAHRKEWAPVNGHFRAVIILNEKKRRSNIDADNRIKACLDFLQRVGLIENDALCDGVTAEWGWAPSGCTVHLIPATRSEPLSVAIPETQTSRAA